MSDSKLLLDAARDYASRIGLLYSELKPVDFDIIGAMLNKKREICQRKLQEIISCKSLSARVWADTED